MSIMSAFRSHNRHLTENYVRFQGTLIIYHTLRPLFSTLSISMAGAAHLRQSPQKPCGCGVAILHAKRFNNLKSHSIKTLKRNIGRVAKRRSRMSALLSKLFKGILLSQNKTFPKSVFLKFFLRVLFSLKTGVTRASIVEEK